jgi:hypothetical protein
VDSAQDCHFEAAQADLKRVLAPSFLRGQRRLTATIALGLSLIFLAFLPPGIVSLDGASMLEVSKSLVTHQGFTVSADLGKTGRDGRIYSTWYPLLSVTAVPFVYAALLASRATHLPFHYLAGIFAMLWPVILTGATGGAVSLLTIRLGGTPRNAWLAALCFAFGTTAIVYVRTFYAEPLLALLVVVSLYVCFGQSAEILLAAGLAALAMLAKPSAIVLGPILSGYLFARRTKWRIACLPALGTATGFLFYGLYNYMRFGQFADFGPKWTFNVLTIPRGAAGLLLSPGWGLLWYSPVTILAVLGLREVPRAKRLEAGAVAATFLAFLLLHSYWKFWFAGWSWGPRLLYPTIPGLCVLAGFVGKRSRKLLATLCILGFVINAPTLVSFYERYFTEMAERGMDLNASYAWSVRYAPGLNGYQAAAREIRDATRTDVRKIYAERETPGTTIASSRAYRVVAVWWWVLPLAGVSRWVGFLVALILIAAGCYLLIRAAPPPDTEAEEAVTE